MQPHRSDVAIVYRPCQKYRDIGRTTDKRNATVESSATTSLGRHRLSLKQRFAQRDGRIIRFSIVWKRQWGRREVLDNTPNTFSNLIFRYPK